MPPMAFGRPGSHVVRVIKLGDIIGMIVGHEPADEAEYFYTCAACGQAVDERDLGQVLHHEEPGHLPLPVS